MRTTIEITEGQHGALTALAQHRGLRGFSEIVQEALDAYLNALSTTEVEFLLGLEGALTDAEASEVRTRVEAVRERWRAS